MHLSLLLLGPPLFLSSHAFTPNMQMTAPRAMYLFSSVGGSNSNPGENDSFDLEVIRAKLECLMDGEKQMLLPLQSSLPPSYAGNDEEVITAVAASGARRPPLTTLGRARREAEIELLAQLATSDEALGQLWEIWFDERGPEAASRLLESVENEGALRSLVADHPDWAEAMNRLATMLYMQKRYDESLYWCQRVLAIKPWHFGALSGIVMVLAAQKDATNARVWAARRLPSCESPRRRGRWVEQAILQARQLLKQSEEELITAFGEPDLRQPTDDWQ